MEAGRAFVAANQIAALTASVAAVVVMAASRSSVVRMLWLLVGLTRCLAAVGRPNQCLYNLRHVHKREAQEKREQLAVQWNRVSNVRRVSQSTRTIARPWYSRASIRQSRSHCGTFLRLPTNVSAFNIRSGMPAWLRRMRCYRFVHNTIHTRAKL